MYKYTVKHHFIGLLRMILFAVLSPLPFARHHHRCIHSMPYVCDPLACAVMLPSASGTRVELLSSMGYIPMIIMAS